MLDRDFGERVETNRRNALRLLMWWTAPAPGIEVP